MADAEEDEEPADKDEQGSNAAEGEGEMEVDEEAADSKLNNLKNIFTFAFAVSSR